MKYQDQKTGGNTDELLTVKFRYKKPDGSKSKLIVKPLKNEDRFDSDPNLKWAAAVAGFGMMLRDSEFKNDLTYADVINLARSAKGADEFGYRAEFISLVEIAGQLQ